MNDHQNSKSKNLIAAVIDAAEDIRDPLHGLCEITSTDPGAPFAPEVLERLTSLKKDDRAAFEALRGQLKKAGCRVTELDHAIAGDNGGKGGRDRRQADILIELAQTAPLFHTPDGTGFADLDVNGHRETWPIRSKGFRRWVARGYFEATQGAPSSEALQSALNVIEANSHFDAPERKVHIRVGGQDGLLYLDLADETWRAVEIDATGWRVIDGPPVRFRRSAGMQPLPMPVCGGSIETLRSFLNVKTDAAFALVIASGWVTHVYFRNEWRTTMIEHTANRNGNDWVTSAKLRQQHGDVSPNTVLRWRHDEDLGFPAPTKVNGRNYWRAADLKRWQDEQAAKQNAA